MISAVALRYFGEVVRCGSIRAAAERLQVAASAISRQLVLLEGALGAPLLERGPGRAGLRMTPAGEIVMRYLRQSEQELDRVRSEIEALKGLRKGHLRLGIPETFVRDCIPQLLARFTAMHPGMTWQVEVAGTPHLVDLVAADELDLAITFNPPPSPYVEHVLAWHLPTRVLLADGHPLAGRESLTLAECAEHPMAMPDHTISARREYDAMFAKARVRPRPVLVTSSYELLRSVAAAGLAIAIVNDRPGGSAPPAGHRYIPLKDPHAKPQRMTVCAFNGRPPSPMAARFIEQLKLEFQQLEQA